MLDKGPNLKTALCCDRLGSFIMKTLPLNDIALERGKHGTDKVFYN
jgi:hypothetical protein